MKLAYSLPLPVSTMRWHIKFIGRISSVLDMFDNLCGNHLREFWLEIHFDPSWKVCCSELRITQFKSKAQFCDDHVNSMSTPTPEARMGYILMICFCFLAVVVRFQLIFLNKVKYSTCPRGIFKNYFVLFGFLHTKAQICLNCQLHLHASEQSMN